MRLKSSATLFVPLIGWIAASAAAQAPCVGGAAVLSDAPPPPRDVTLETLADPAALARLQAPGEVLFTDTFESSASLAEYFEVRGQDDGRVALEDAEALAHTGRGALRCTAPARGGESSGAGVSAWLGDEGHARVHLRRYIRFADDYDQGSLNHTGGGLEGVAGVGKWDGMGQAGLRPRGDDRFSCRFEPWRDWGRVAAPGYMFLYTYWMDMARDRDGNFWGNMLQPPPECRSVPKRGAWVCLEQMIQVNTVGQADGELAAWIDGELYLHFTGIRWRTEPRLLVKRFELGVYVHAATRANTVWYDDVVVSTGYVGPIAAKATPASTQEPQRDAVAPRRATKGWIWFEDRNAAHPPTLVLTLAGGEVRRVEAGADTTLIAYLAERAWGALESLAVDTTDQNRVLLAFELGKPQGIEAAHLELWLHQSEMPTDGALALNVHPLLAGFEEDSATWSQAPRFDDLRAAQGVVGPNEGGVTIDVTALVTPMSSDAPRSFGLLLKAAQPVVATTQPPSSETQGVEGELREMLAWASDLEAALARAGADDRNVLALLVADFGHGGFTEHERLLLATCLAHPAVRAEIDAHWVPVVLRVSPNVASFAVEQRGQTGDPLARLGLDVGDVRPPALIALDRRGKVRGKLTEISAFDHVEVLGLLGAQERPSSDEVARAFALMRKGELGAADAALAALPTEPEARYWRAALAAARGDRASAERELSALENDARDTPWALKARARRALPNVVEGFEVLTPSTRATNSAARIRAAVDGLCRRQLPDGSFPMGTTPYEPHRLGVTVIAAHALALHGRTAEEERARQWIVAQLSATPIKSLDSFAAAYWLDYTVARTARDEGSPNEVTAAIELLLAGQLANGAWSYNKDFGDGWRGGFGGWPATDKGRAHSMNTAQALDSLLRARAAGHTVDAGALERGRDALLAMRVAPAQFTYTWPEPKCFDALDANIARAPLAEAVLRRFEANEQKDLELALATFEAGLGHLRGPGKLTDSWLPPHGLSAYFRAYAWHHGALAAEVRGGAAAQKLKRRIREEILAACEPDGTWLDSFTFGKAHGTAAALLALAATD